ncbi:MAG: hypothetical protein O9972_25900 [Burkholderiales bacterium]|nr:hypothetical protein [Burkholderiales bacterium]
MANEGPSVPADWQPPVPQDRAELNRPDVSAQATGILRKLIEEIRLVPENGRLEIEVVGDLAGIVALGPNDKRPIGSAGGAQVTLVAGTRNHLYRTVVRNSNGTSQLRSVES